MVNILAHHLVELPNVLHQNSIWNREIPKRFAVLVAAGHRACKLNYPGFNKPKTRATWEGE